MSEKIFWGLDIGGTKCAICAAGEDGKIFYREQVAWKWERKMPPIPRR